MALLERKACVSRFATTDMDSFAQTLIHWHASYGRHDLPWQNTRDPYRIWLSEVMLQQTQVTSVIDYFERFLKRLPTLAALAAAPLDEVLSLWSGLGYYSRARNLHRAAKLVMVEHDGAFPRDPAALARLPGIGRSTAAAIAAFTCDTRAAILDGNVKRVLARVFGIDGYPGEKKVEAKLWQLAEQLLPSDCGNMPIYTQALMDFGATVCTRSKPRCSACPLRSRCVAWNTDRVSELPQPRPRKEIPARSTTLLLLIDGPRYYFEKRPPTGIWGGMLSFPEAQAEENLIEICAARFGAKVEYLPALESFTHTFTHFRLTILPQPMRVAKLVSRCAQDPGLWLTPGEAMTKALPAPIRRILTSREVAWM